MFREPWIRQGRSERAGNVTGVGGRHRNNASPHPQRLPLPRPQPRQLHHRRAARSRRPRNHRTPRQHLLLAFRPQGKRLGLWGPPAKAVYPPMKAISRLGSVQKSDGIAAQGSDSLGQAVD